jgi:predicted SAM-dependent methyltransferase
MHDAANLRGRRLGQFLRHERPITESEKVRALVGRIVRNRSLFLDRSAIRRKDYLDVGCGPQMHEQFINLDYGWRPGLDACWDIRKGLPLDDASVRGIFTEHCLEHIPLGSADAVLAEFRRVLRPGGRVRIVVPDGELYLTRYADVLAARTAKRLPYADEDPHRGIYSPILSVNRIFRAHGHQFIYDYDFVRRLLEDHGFVDVRREQYRSGQDPVLLIDSEHRRIESLYVEASAPAR